jgi:hypothetical protein
MTNRARPTWPDGAADSSKPQTPPGRNSQGANGRDQSTPPATPASNGRSGSSGNGGQQRPGTPGGQKPADFRQPQRPTSPSTQSGSTAGKPARPPQQPPVRPAVKQTPPATTPPATPRPATPSTPGRPEPRTPAATPASGGQPVTAAYGQTGKVVTPSSAPETFGDKVNAAKQAVLEKAAAVKEATQGSLASVGSVGLDSKAKTATTPAAKASTRPQTRKARLRLSRLDPWSVMKTSFLLSIAFGIVTWVAVFIVWSAIGAAGVFDNINNTVSEVLGTPSAEPFRIENYINTGKVMGFTTLLACADVLIITALATLGSFLYNIAATLLGGLEVTLASED